MKIFFIIGRSGSGKDTLKNNILNFTDIEVDPMVEITNRPMRPNEENEREHIFVSDEEMDEIIKNKFYKTRENEILEYRSYDVVEDKKWIYANMIINSSDKKIYVGTGPANAYKSVLKAYGPDVVKPIYIETSHYNLLKRSIDRIGPNASEASYKEICRRFIFDSDDFSEKNLNEIGINRRNTFKNNDSIACTLGKIRTYIIRNTKHERMLQSALPYPHYYDIES